MTVRRIWMLWLQGLEQAPPVVRACVDSWSRWNPDWELEVLSADTLARWVHPGLAASPPAPITPQRLSDLVRASLLCRHGGVWADATCLCMRPLSTWLPDAEFFAFERPGPDRLISSWLLAASADSYVARRLWEQFHAYCRRPFVDGGWRGWLRDRLAPRLSRNARTTDWWLRPPLPQLGISPYFAFHYTFNRLVRVDPAFRRAWENAPKISADGPHHLLAHGYARPASPELLSEIEHRSVPVYKLSWRIDPAQLPRSAALNAVLAGGPTR